jgi:hypothetical protein
LELNLLSEWNINLDNLSLHFLQKIACIDPSLLLFGNLDAWDILSVALFDDVADRSDIRVVLAEFRLLLLDVVLVDYVVKI